MYMDALSTDMNTKTKTAETQNHVSSVLQHFKTLVDSAWLTKRSSAEKNEKGKKKNENTVISSNMKKRLSLSATTAQFNQIALPIVVCFS